jgi:transposase
MRTYEAAGRPIVYVDESGFAHEMPRTHGYSPRGQRCYGTYDWQAKGRTNVIGALLGKELLVTSLFEIPINRTIFSSWFTQELLPKIPKNSVVVLDNATFHKKLDLQAQLQKASVTLEYLAPYSPDLNPIEKKWAHLKSIRRKLQCSVNSLFFLIQFLFS